MLRVGFVREALRRQAARVWGERADDLVFGPPAADRA